MQRRVQGGTLLERLADREADARRTGRIDLPRIVDSVLRNLGQILNTRRGAALTSPDYGLPEFSEIIHALPDVVAELQRDIKACIEHYEPRLKDVVVTYAPAEDDVLMLRFDVRGRLVLSGQRQQVWFETTIDSAGKTEVRGSRVAR